MDAGRSALRRLGDERKLLLVQPKQFGSGAACGHRASRRRLVVDDTYLVPGGSQAGSRLLLVPEGATVDRQRKELPLSAREGANGAWRDIAVHAHQRVHRYLSTCLHNR